MDTLRVLHTQSLAKTKRELESVGGRVVHRLGKSSVVVSLPRGVTPRKLKACSAKPPKALSDDERLPVQCWKGTPSHRGSGEAGLMSRSTREGVVWGEDSFLAPKSHDPAVAARRARAAKKTSRAARAAAVAESTGIATSLRLTRDRWP